MKPGSATWSGQALRLVKDITTYELTRRIGQRAGQTQIDPSPVATLHCTGNGQPLYISYIAISFYL